jgi:SPX domain protein involved in polyphosphate accumulation
MLRHERKYLVPFYMLNDLRARFSGFVRPDIFTEEDMFGKFQYTVRSIYFDSPDLGNYHEKLSGVMDRCKLRVRGYNELEPKEMVVLEVKKKKGNRILKHRTMIPYNRLAEVLETGDVSPYLILRKDQTVTNALDEASRFFFHYKRKNQSPTCLITYEREAYHGKHNPGIRITFDKNMRSKINPGLPQLFDNDNLRPLFKSHFILEVKYFEDNMPAWIKSIIYEFKLRTDALSKYVIGYDVSKRFAQY